MFFFDGDQMWPPRGPNAWGPLMAPSRRDVARIRALNDQLRQTGPISTDDTRWLFTSGVQALGLEALVEIVRLVRTFSAFDGDNDPHGEHDFAALALAGQRLYWKIDYYNRSLDGGSPDPGDEAVTCRVLTIMLASEY